MPVSARRNELICSTSLPNKRTRWSFCSGLLSFNQRTSRTGPPRYVQFTVTSSPDRTVRRRGRISAFNAAAICTNEKKWKEEHAKSIQTYKCTTSSLEGKGYCKMCNLSILISLFIYPNLSIRLSMYKCINMQLLMRSKSCFLSPVECLCTISVSNKQ